MKATIKLTSNSKKDLTVTYDFNGNYFIHEINKTLNQNEMSHNFKPGYFSLFCAQLRKENMGVQFEVKSFQGNTGRHRFAEINGSEVSQEILSAIFDSGKDGIYTIEEFKIGESSRKAIEAAQKTQEKEYKKSQMFEN